MHTRHVLHNRDAMTAGFYQPLPPTTFVVDKALSHCVRLVPVEIPDKICGCSPESLRVSPGKTVAVITINGRYDLSMPELSCEACQATWAAGVVDLNRSDYWPATLQFSTMYATDVFFSFEEMKMAAPGLSCQAFLRMLDQRTVRFGRTGKISTDSFQKSFFEWEAVRYEVDKICKEEHFICPACTPDMLAVSVDGNRRTDMLTLMVMRWNQQKFNNLATALTRRYQKTTKALQSQLQNLESIKVELAVTESQLEDWVNDVKDWADATTTTTNDVDALANRIEVLVASVKRRSQRLYKDTDGNKGRARIRRKIREEKGILTSLVETYNRMVPNTETLCLETILSGETAWPWQLPHSDSVDLRTKRKAFDIIMSVRRLQEEQKILVAEMDHHWKYLSTRAETLRELSCLFASETLQSSLCGLSEDGLKGLQSIIHKKQRKIRDMRVQARDCYLQVLSGAVHTNFLNKSSADDYDSDFEISDDEL
ncbi:ATP-binding cassette sub-family D member 3 [Labeo rohita]|uniref:ATP-binding cassette sub-family D member 3 n=1 Tax=Labeo rohita TaxID=84645 RepID=A0A498NFK0_LABRO|nr:ATP-binding cassette sub-family D member 3 [Labeo rohita]